MTVNYRAEPIATRILDPLTNSQASGDAGDLAMVFRSDVVRADPVLNTQPSFYPPLTSGVQPGDPYTPLMQVYDGDRVQIRTMVGATEELHNFSLNGLKWLFQPSWANSGWRSSQAMGISEHFEFNSPIIRPKGARGPFSDYLYKPGSSTDDLWNGLWGLLRTYKDQRLDLQPLPSNPPGGPPMGNPEEYEDTTNYKGVCPADAPKRVLDVTAALAQDILPEGRLIYNSRTGAGAGPLNDPTAIMYVRSYDLDANGMLKPGVPVEPLILRANAGDCIKITVRNKLPAVLPHLDGMSTLPMIVNHFNANDIVPSSHVGLHPQLLASDVTRSDGMNVGFNPVQTAAPGTKQKYKWYAGDLSMQPTGQLLATPVEFGTVGLAPADPIKQASKGLIGALIIEPAGATWVEDADSRASATVTMTDATSFREFVLMFQSDINMRYGDGSVIANTAQGEEPEDSGQKAFNYRTEPMWFRMGFEPDTPLGGHGELAGGPTTRDMDFTNVLSNSQVGGDPETPVFMAAAGTPVRFRVLKPGGNQRNHVFQVHGHAWQQEPYTNGSTEIGDNPLSQWHGNQMGIGPSSHFDILLQNGAGGKFGVVGDYLYRDMASFLFDGGLWGIFRVGDACLDDAGCDDGLFCNGVETCDPEGGCQLGTDPCPGLMCSEALTSCINIAGGIDNCPTDPLKVEPGLCGCGVADTDTDGDTVPDCLDECPGFDDRIDSDMDGIADACDLCPGVEDHVTLKIKAKVHSVGSGKKPKSRRKGMKDVEVCIYGTAATSCAAAVCGGSGQTQYECIVAACDPVSCCVTDKKGRCTIETRTGAYVAIAADETLAILPDPIGKSFEATDCGGSKKVRLKQLVRGDGKKIPGKSRKVKLHPDDLEELIIVEPDHIVWDNEDQQYPFVFQSVGNWGVTTGVTPPEGFVSTDASLSTPVVDDGLNEDEEGEDDSVQFDITEIGSDLIPTPTTFVFERNGVTNEVKSEVGIYLTPEYAASRGFDVAALRRQGLIKSASPKARSGKAGGQRSASTRK